VSAPSASAPLVQAMPPWARAQSVWEVCQRVKGQLGRDEHLLDAWVQGEVSNCKAPPSGHLYFTLKDPHAQLQCVVFEAARTIPFEVRDGMALLLHGRVDLYPSRGQVQLVADQAHPRGQGALHAAFEQRKEKLAREGLFDASRKRPLPAFPERIGLITSLQGAALRDMLRILSQRYPLARVVVRNVRVQGDGAAMEVAHAIALANRHAVADVLIVGRGGGSIEDLWAFNEEPVARAIASSTIPVISAVGHETDTTIADFAADLRAATPSNAAEVVVPHQEDLRDMLAQRERRLHQRALRGLATVEHRLAALEQRAALRKPARLLEQWAQRLDEASLGLARAGHERLRAADERLAKAAALLDSYSPLRTLQRGYAIVAVQGKAATSVAQLPPGSRIAVQVADGRVEAVVHG
jgi:exodeoxyribonuclease VII large subunit